MKRLIIFVFILSSTIVLSQNWETPLRFPVQGEQSIELRKTFYSNTPWLISQPSILTSKNNGICIDTLYLARYTTGFYDVLDSDSAYFISGHTCNERHLILDPDNPTMLVRMKVSYSGQLLWQHIDSMMRGDHFTMYNTSLIKTSDNNFVQMGVVVNDYNDFKDYMIRLPVYIKFNSNGDTLWRKLYTDTVGRRGGDWPQNIVAENDGGFTVAALTPSLSKTYSLDTNINFWYNDTTYVSLIKYDSFGNEVHRKSHVIGGELVPMSIGLLMKQDDGGYIIGGANQFNGTSNPAKYYLLKVDSLFNWQWIKTFGQTFNNMPLLKIQKLSGTFSYFAAYHIDTPMVVSSQQTYYTSYNQIGRMDSNFDIIDDTIFYINLAPVGSPPVWYYQSFGEIRGLTIADNNNLIVCDNLSVGAHLLQIDSNYQVKWSRWISHFPDFAETVYKMRKAHDGGYLIVGKTDYSGKGGWFVKTDTNGFALPNGADTLYHIGISESDPDSYRDINKPLVIYPNPASDVFYLSVDDKDFSNGILNIYDLTGRLKNQHKLNVGKNSINIEELSSGMYLVRIKSSKGKIQTGKLIVK